MSTAKTRPMPENAKVKAIKVPFDDDRFTVRIEEEKRGSTRVVHVWMDEHAEKPLNRMETKGIKRGQYLGSVEQHYHQTSRHLFGNVSSFGKSRAKWFPSGQGWSDHESIAAAIRTIVAEARV